MVITDHRSSTRARLVRVHLLGARSSPRRRGWGTAHPGPPGEPPDPAAAAPMHAAAASAAHGGGVGAALVEVLQSAAAPAAATRLSQGITTTEGGCGTTSSASAAAGRTETPGGGVTRHAHVMTWSASSCPVKIPLQARAQHAERARRRGVEGGCQRATTRVGRGREGVGRACAVPHGMWSPCLPTTVGSMCDNQQGSSSLCTRRATPATRTDDEPRTRRRRLTAVAWRRRCPAAVAACSRRARRRAVPARLLPAARRRHRRRRRGSGAPAPRESCATARNAWRTRRAACPRCPAPAK